jgi:hypothetical protein
VIANPLLDIWNQEQRHRAEGVLFERERTRCCSTYSWAIPNEAALRTIAEYSPIVEIGAGTGYWASLLRTLRADVIAYDIAPPDLGGNPFHKLNVTHTYVKFGDVSAVCAHHNRTLLLCWPPFDSPMAADCLRLYRGNRVIYIGEGHEGCTGDLAFHLALDADWNEVKSVTIPQWYGLHDVLTVYERKPTTEPTP